MRERNDGARVGRISQCPGQPDRRNAHIANLHRGPGYVFTASAICGYAHLGTTFRRPGRLRGPVLPVNANQSRLVPAASSVSTATGVTFYRSCALEIRLVCHRHVIVEQMPVVLGADFLHHGSLNTIVALHHRPRRVERIRNPRT